ncbi:MAG: laccase domain-containing protein, partial [Parachlamydiaceae bacterium]
VNYKEEFPESFSEFEIKPLHFDFWEISERQLKSAGVLPHHIQTARIDTYSNEDFFSFRRSKTTGRQATICSLRTKLS